MIEGTRINLRAPEFTDLDRNRRWINDREVTRYLAARYPVSDLAEEAWLRNLVSSPMSFAHVFFAIETKDGRHIGNCDLGALPEDRAATLGIMIGEPDCWSRGYGSDAVTTLLRFAFDEMNLNKVALTVFDGNARALACYRRCGFVEEGRMRQARYFAGAHHDLVIMSVLRDEWRATEAAPEDAGAERADGR